MEDIFLGFTHYVAMGLEFLAVVVIAIGGLDACVRLGPAFIRWRGSQQARRAAWLSLARWLLLGLEFTLAADIVRTVISPDWNDIGELAAIALIRTFLNFFLERDLDSAAKEESVLQTTDERLS